VVNIKIRPSNKTFFRRYAEAVVFFGIPMTMLDLVRAPFAYWLPGLVILVPALLVGLLVTTAVEHAFFGWIRRRQQAASHSANPQ
jgi:hypothetical protein